MSVDQKDISAVLANRQFLYALFGRILGEEPTAELVDLLGSGQTALEFSLFGPAEGDYARFLAAIDGLVAEGEEGLSRLSGEYTYLFIGPHVLPSPPWESVHVSGVRQIFQERTLEVRNFYRSMGFLPASYPSVADDHIAIEMNFMAELAGQSLEAYQAGAEGRLGYLLERQQAFLKEHVLDWIRAFGDGLGLQKRTGPFYQLAAQAAAYFCEQDRILLEELMVYFPHAL